MKSTFRTIAGFAFCSLLALPVGAAQEKEVYKPVRQQVFERLDQNHDEKLDAEEFFDGSVGRAAANKQEEFGQLDQDGDGFLSFDEYRKFRKSKAPDPKAEMNKLDADGDDKLTLQEYLADKSARIACRRTFLRHDTNEDGLLTLDELKRPVAGVKQSPRTLFKMRDDDQDGQLTVVEFNLWREEPEKIRAGEAEFTRHDEDGDGFLTFEEFQFTPTAGPPSQEALFEKMDSDDDSRLTPDDLTRSMSSGQAAWASSTFAEFDTNNDGGLDFAEYKARREELDRRHQARTAPPKWAWWKKLLVAAGIMVVVGVMLVLFVPWQRIRRPRRLRGVLERMESLKRRLTTAIEAARRRWRWGIGLLAVAAVCLLSLLLWRTLAHRAGTTSSLSTLAFSEPTEFEARGRSLEFNSEIGSVAFSDNSRLLAVAHGSRGTAGAVRVWFLNKRKVFASWEEPNGVFSVHISPSGRLVASQSFGDRRVRIRSVESGKEVLEIDVGNLPARVRFSPDGKTLATALLGGAIKLWNVNDGKELKTFSPSSLYLHCVAFSRDGKRIVAAGPKTEILKSESAARRIITLFGCVEVWDIASGSQIVEIQDVASVVLGVAISPNGELVATAERHFARLWETETGKLVSSLSADQSTLMWVDFSPDGKMLAGAGYDRTAKIWSVESGQELATLSGHIGDVMTTRFSPDGKTLVTAGSEGRVRLWDVATWQETDVLHPDWSEDDVPEPVLAIAYAPDQKLVASAHGDKTVRLRDPSTGRMVRLLEGNDHLVSCIAFSPDGRLLATAGGDKIVKLRDVDGTREAISTTLVGHTDEILSVAFSPDGKRLASSGEDKTIRLWDVVSGDQQAKLEGHSEAVRSVAYSADGKRLASGGDDGAVKIWDPETARELATLTGHTGSIQAVAFSPDGKTLASAGEDKSVKLWDVQSGEVRLTLTGHAEMVRCLAFSPQGATLASGGLDNLIELWDPASGNHRATLRGHDDAVTSLVFTPDTGDLISGSQDKTIRYWKSQPPRFPSIATLQVTGEGARCRFGIFSPDGKQMITAGDDKVISVWDMRTGRLLRSDEYRGGTPICGSLSPDGKLLATGTYGETVYLWDVTAGRRVGELVIGEKKLYAIDFSPDGTRLAVSSASGTVSVWEVRAWAKLWMSPWQSLPVVAVVFSPDGKTLVTTTYDWKKPRELGEVKLWDAENGKELAVLWAEGRGHMHARFSADGKLLVTGSGDRALRIWEVESRQLRSTISTPRTVSCLALLPGGQWILTGHHGAATSVWDIDSGRLMAEYIDAAEGLSVQEVRCSPDGSLIAAAGTKGAIAFWGTLPEESTPAATSASRVLEWSTEKLSLKGKP